MSLRRRLIGITRAQVFRDRASEADAERALAALHACPGGAEARRIRGVLAEDPGRVVLHTRVGSDRLLERLSGEQARFLDLRD